MSNVQTIAVTADEADLRLDRWFKRRFPSSAMAGSKSCCARPGPRRGSARALEHAARTGPARSRAAAGRCEKQPRRAGVRHPRFPERDVRTLLAAILYKDDDVLAINKPAGLAVQGGTGLDRHLDAMLDALQFDATERPRLVHRLDRDTSGVLLLARNARAAAELAQAFRRRDCRKVYWAVVAGVPKPVSGRIDLALASGRAAPASAWRRTRRARRP